MHQVRASLLACGYPIVGGKLYGLDEGCYLRFAQDGLSEKDSQGLILSHQALHASRIGFVDRKGPCLELEAAAPWSIIAR